MYCIYWHVITNYVLCVLYKGPMMDWFNPIHVANAFEREYRLCFERMIYSSFQYWAITEWQVICQANEKTLVGLNLSIFQSKRCFLLPSSYILHTHYSISKRDHLRSYEIKSDVVYSTHKTKRNQKLKTEATYGHCIN